MYYALEHALSLCVYITISMCEIFSFCSIIITIALKNWLKIWEFALQRQKLFSCKNDTTNLVFIYMIPLFTAAAEEAASLNTQKEMKGNGWKVNFFSPDKAMIYCHLFPHVIIHCHENGDNSDRKSGCRKYKNWQIKNTRSLGSRSCRCQWRLTCFT